MIIYDIVDKFLSDEENIKALNANNFDKLFENVVSFTDEVDEEMQAHFMQALVNILNKADIDVMSHITSLPQYYYYNDKMLGEVGTFPENITEIGWGCFWMCENLEKVHIPGTVKIIGSYAFSGCESLKTIIIDEGVERIEQGAFAYCDLGDKIAIPRSVKFIDGDAFEDVTSLRAVVYEGSYAHKWFEAYADEDVYEVIK